MNNNYKISTFKEIAESFGNYNSYVLSGHRNPDGDSIGSCESLGYCLQEMRKNVFIVDSCNSDFNDEKILESDYCFIQLDVQPEHRIVDESLKYKEGAKFSICIDHHPQEELNCNLVYVDNKVAANAINVWYLIKLLDITITKNIAQSAYYGLCSDTNSFTNTNSDIYAFEAAIEMIKYGANPSKAAQELFQSRSLSSLKLEKIILDRLYVDKDNKFAFSYLGSDDYLKYNASKNDSDAAINLLRELKCVDVACVIRQEKAGDNIHGSLRSKTDIDVSKLAKLHTGGGHKAAAGFTMEETNLEKAIDVVKSQLTDLMKKNI